VRNRLTVFVLILVSLAFGLLVARRMVQTRGLSRTAFEEKTLHLLTYSTFIGTYGPGTEILRRFEKEHGCKIEVVTATDAGLLLQRLKFAQAGAAFDVVLGLDQLLLDEAKSGYEWQKLETDKSGWYEAPAAESTDEFAAFDWSPLTFVYRKDGAAVPANFDDLLDKRYAKQFALQDPRASTPGLQFYKWVKALKGAHTAEWLAAFKPNVNSVSPSWAFAYGLFKKKQTRFVFSYLTSLAFHWGDEKDRGYDVLNFPEGHPVQVEFAAVPKNCKECELARAFVHTLHLDWAQKLLMTKSYMFPVVKGLEDGTVFSELPKLKTLSTEAGKDLGDWDKVFPH
jgi:thiamine transport system substrate-binding protein